MEKFRTGMPVPDMVRELNRLDSRQAGGLTAISTTSVEIGLGERVLSVGPDKQFVPGQPVRVASQAGPSSNWMEGTIIAYSDGAATIFVDAVSGSGTCSDWSVSITGQPGASGASDSEQLGLEVTSEPPTQVSGPEFGKYAAALVDEQGRMPWGITEEGVMVAISAIIQSLFVDGGDGGGYNYPIAVVDENGNVGGGLLDGEWKLAAGSGRSLVVELEQFSQALRVSEPQYIPCAALAWTHNGIIGNGQSLMSSQESWPAITRTARHPRLLMLGNSVRPSGGSTTAFSPVGGAAFRPHVGTVQAHSGGTPLTDSAVAALPVGDGALGETPLESMAHGLLSALHDHLQTLDAQRNLVSSSVAVPGRTVEQLRKGASPELYQRFTAAIQQAKDLATANSGTYGVAVIGLMQGENNYDPTRDGAKTFAEYKEQFLGWVDEQCEDARAITGQALPPAVISYQTGASYSRDENELAIGMAQWAATRERENLFIASPMYPMTDKGGHLDSNGSRWLGWMFAKAARAVVVERRPWRPLEPVRIAVARRSVYVAYRVPKPPLQFRRPYVMSAATDYPDRGFRVTDSSGPAPISSVQIVSPCVIRIDLQRDLAANALVWYASKTATNGNGCVCDSDSEVAADLYEYLPGSGMYPSANVAALVGKPYPLNNWSIAFCLPVGYQETFQ